MAAVNSNLVDNYIIALRIIQPARVQDIVEMQNKIWKQEITEELRVAIYKIHENMKADGMLLQVRQGTYVLDSKGLDVAARLIEERTIDNARLFLMKQQRKKYHRTARRLGLVPASGDQTRRSSK